MAQKDIKDLKAQFDAIDTDKTGYIEASELQAAFKKQDKIADDDLEKIILNVDYAGNHKINYTEFIAATLDINEVLEKHEDHLRGVFNSLDIDNTGKITRSNLKIAFTKYGRVISDEEIDNILVKHDKQHDQAINFDEFKQMIQDN